MNSLTQLEANYLRDMNPYILPGASRQEIINLLRATMKANKRGFQKDVIWKDEELL